MHGHGHGHGGHGHGGHGHGISDAPTPERALWVAVVLNGLFLLVEAGVGWWSGSLALLSDAGHMLSDVGSLLVAVVALRLRTLRPSEGYTFGLRRAPVLGALINAVALVVIVLLIGVEAYERVQTPRPLDGTWVLWTAIMGFLVNVVSAAYLARSRDRSVNVQGAMLHLLADALGSVAAIVSAGLILGWQLYLADPVASFVIAFLILLGSLPLLRETLAILLQRAPSRLDMGKLREMICAVPGISRVTDLHVWELDSGSSILTAHLEMPLEELTKANRAADVLRERLQSEFGIDHATLECRHCDSPDCTPEY